MLWFYLLQSNKLSEDYLAVGKFDISSIERYLDSDFVKNGLV